MHFLLKHHAQINVRKLCAVGKGDRKLGSKLSPVNHKFVVFISNLRWNAREFLIGLKLSHCKNWKILLIDNSLRRTRDELT